jgi:hypothetical protein
MGTGLGSETNFVLPSADGFRRPCYSDPVTFGWLIERGVDVGLHCFRCGRHAVLKVSSLPFALATPVPSTAGRFKCTRCGTRQTEARPEWPNEGGRVKEIHIAGR